MVVLWWRPDAVLSLRASGTLAADAMDCDLNTQPCVATFADGSTVTLTVGPTPVTARSPMSFVVRVVGDSAPSAVELVGVDMPMGLIHVPLSQAGEDWTGEGVLPACVEPVMAWRADVVFPDRTATFLVNSTRPD